MPELHFIEISRDRRVYIGERGQNRIQVFTTEGTWLQDIMVSPDTPARGCGGVASVKGWWRATKHTKGSKVDPVASNQSCTL